MTITPECCPKTLEILARTGCLSVNINWTRDACEAMAKALCRAAKEGA
jgi:cell division inhibitor SulA